MKKNVRYACVSIPLLVASCGMPMALAQTTRDQNNQTGRDSGQNYQGNQHNNRNQGQNQNQGNWDQNQRNNWGQNQAFGVSEYKQFAALKGCGVKSADGRHLGDVEDLIVDRGSGMIRYAIVDPDGMADNVAVPFHDLTWRNSDNCFVTQAGMLRGQDADQLDRDMNRGDNNQDRDNNWNNNRNDNNRNQGNNQNWNNNQNSNRNDNLNSNRGTTSTTTDLSRYPTYNDNDWRSIDRDWQRTDTEWNWRWNRGGSWAPARNDEMEGRRNERTDNQWNQPGMGTSGTGTPATTTASTTGGASNSGSGYSGDNRQGASGATTVPAGTVDAHARTTGTAGGASNTGSGYSGDDPNRRGTTAGGSGTSTGTGGASNTGSGYSGDDPNRRGTASNTGNTGTTTSTRTTTTANNANNNQGDTLRSSNSGTGYSTTNSSPNPADNGDGANRNNDNWAQNQNTNQNWSQDQNRNNQNQDRTTTWSQNQNSQNQNQNWGQGQNDNQNRDQNRNNQNNSWGQNQGQNQGQWGNNDWQNRPVTRETYDPFGSKLSFDKTTTVSGEIRDINRQFVPGHGEQVVVTVRKDDGGEKKVALGPSWYVNGIEMAPKRGDKVTITAVKAPEMTAQADGRGNMNRDNTGNRDTTSRDATGRDTANRDNMNNNRDDTTTRDTWSSRDNNNMQGGNAWSSTQWDPDILIATEVRLNENNRTYSLRNQQGAAWTQDTFTTGNNQQVSAPMYRMLRVSKIDGADLDCRGTACGEVDEVIIDVNGGMVAFLSIDPDDNFLGVGDSKRLVPWTVATVSLDNRVRIDADKAMVMASPETPDDFNNFGATASRVYDAYQIQQPRRQSMR